MASKKQQVFEFVLETLIYEVYKDGRVSDEEKVISKALISHLKISTDHYKKIRSKVLKSIKPNKQTGEFDPEAFFAKIRGKLLTVVSPLEANKILKRISVILEYELRDEYLSEYSEKDLKDLRSPDVAIRSAAIFSLLASPRKDKSKILEKLLNKEKDIQLRYEIRKALSAVSSLQNVKKKKRAQFDTDQATEDYSSVDPLALDDLSEVKKYCLAMVRARKADSLPTLLKLEERWADPHIKACVLSLIPFASQEYSLFIDKYFYDEDDRVVAKAIEAAELTGDTSMVGHLIDLVNHESNRVKANAVKALHSFGEAGLFEIVKGMCTSASSAERDSAAYTLSQIDLDNQEMLLEVLATDATESVRSKAISKLEKLSARGSQQAKDILAKVTNLGGSGVEGGATQGVEALESDSAIIRMQALPAVVENLDSESAVAEVFDRLKKEQEPRVLATGIQSLTQIEGFEQEKIKVFTHFLKSSEDDRVRANSLEGLGQLSKLLEPEVFEVGLEDENNRVRGNAIVALSSYEEISIQLSEKLEASFHELVTHPNKFHQLTAVYCMGVTEDPRLFKAFTSIVDSEHLRVLLEAQQCVTHIAFLDGAEALSKKLDRQVGGSTSSMSMAEVIQVRSNLQTYRKFKAYDGKTDGEEKPKVEDVHWDPEARKVLNESSNKTSFDPSKDMASPISRLAAFWIDLFFLPFWFTILDAVILGLITAFNQALYAVTVPFSVWLYYSAFETMGEFSSTPGKILCGLAVVQEDGRKPTFLQSTKRFWIRILSIFPYYSLTRSKGYRGLHDRVSGLFVIRKGKPLWIRAILLFLLSTALNGLMLWMAYAYVMYPEAFKKAQQTQSTKQKLPPQ